MRVSCLRHGTTALNEQGIFSGAGDEGLTEVQRLELEATSFSTAEYDAVYCGPATRCKETARSLGILENAEEPRLAARCFGIFEGLTAGQCQDSFPDEFRSLRPLDAEYVIPNGESRGQHFDRVVAWLEDILVHDHVLAVTHGGTIDFLYRLGTNADLHGGDEVFSGPAAAVSVFEVEWPQVVVLEYGLRLTG